MPIRCPNALYASHTICPNFVASFRIYYVQGGADGWDPDPFKSLKTFGGPVPSRSYPPFPQSLTPLFLGSRSRPNAECIPQSTRKSCSSTWFLDILGQLPFLL